MPAWDDDTLGAFGSASQIPTNEWFPVNTATGEWGTPTPTLASAAGIPDLIPTRTMAPSPEVRGFGGVGVQPDQGPLSIGQVTGGFAPTMTTPRSIQRVQRLDEMGGLAPKPSAWEGIARAIGMASPQGRAILQASDQQQQQQLTNRLALRRQALSEEQETRAATQDSLNTFLKISQMPNKTMRNLMFDRYVANYQQSTGQSLPADMVEAFKKSSLDEGQQMATMLEPILAGTGIKTEVAMPYLQEGGDPKNLLSLIETGLKVKKEQREQQESQDLTQQLSTLGGASGVTAPATTSTAPTEPPLANVGMRDTDGASAPLPIRMNNPLNIKQGPATQKWIDQGAAVPGDPAQDGGRFLKFQSPQQGVQAAQDLLTGKAYSGLTVDAVLKKWSSNGYGGDIVTGVDPTKKIADLTPSELTRTMGAMLQREGGGTAQTQQPDTRMMVAGPGAPAPTQPTPTGGTRQEHAQLADLNARIAGMDQFVTANAGKGSDRAKATVAAIERQRDNLAKERDRLQDRLTEIPRKVAEAEALSPIRQREAAQQGYASTQARLEAEKQQRQEQALQDVWKDDASQFRNTQTGQAIDPTQRYAEVQTQQRQGGVKRVTKEQEKRLDTVEQVLPVVQKLNQYAQAIYGPGGVMEQASNDPEQRLWLGTKQGMTQLVRAYPILEEADRFMKANAEGLARSLQGVRGAGTEGDVQRALQQFPRLTGAFDIQLWPPKLSMALPDSCGVALRAMDDVNSVLNKATGLVLGNKDFRYEGLMPPTTRPEFQAPQGGRTPTSSADVTRLAPEDTIRRLRAMSPDEIRRADPALLNGMEVSQVFPALQPAQQAALQERLQAYQKAQALYLPLTDPTEAVLPANPTLPRLTPAQITRAPEALIEGLTTPQDVPGLSPEQQRALGMRLARRYMERQRQTH